MSSTKSVAILVAAGQGERLADFTKGIPKQFTLLNDAPVFIWSLSTLANHPAIDQVLITVPSDWQQKAAETVEKFLPQLKQKINLIAGGQTRQQSVYLALEKIASAEIHPTYVLVHDAVRPFITVDILDKIFLELKNNDALTLGIPLYDSIKKVENDLVIKDLDRNEFILVQTPQAAKFDLLLKAHRDANLKQKESTDDATIIKAYNGSVKIIPGSKINFKITDPDDLLIAQALIKHYHWTLAQSQKFGLPSTKI